MSALMATAAALSPSTTAEQNTLAPSDPDGGLSNAALPVAGFFLCSSLAVGLGICCAIKNRYFSCKKTALPQDEILLASVKIAKPYSDDPDADPEEKELLIFASKESFEAGTGINKNKYGRYLRSVGLQPRQITQHIFARENLGFKAESGDLGSDELDQELLGLSNLQDGASNQANSLHRSHYPSMNGSSDDVRSNKSGTSKQRLFGSTLLDYLKPDLGSDDEDELEQGIDHEVMSALLSGKKVLAEAEKLKQSLCSQQGSFSRSDSPNFSCTSSRTSPVLSFKYPCANSIASLNSEHLYHGGSLQFSRAASVTSQVSASAFREASPTFLDVPESWVGSPKKVVERPCDEVDKNFLSAINFSSSINLLPTSHELPRSPGSEEDLSNTTNPFLAATPLPSDSPKCAEIEMAELTKKQTRLLAKKSDPEILPHLKPQWFENIAVHCGEYALCRLAEMMCVGDPNFASDPKYPKKYPFQFTDFSYAIGCGVDIPYGSFLSKERVESFLKKQDKSSKFIVTTRMYGGHHFVVTHDGDGWVSDDQIAGRQRLDDEKTKFINKESPDSAWFKILDKKALLAMITMQKIQKSLGDDRCAEWSFELEKWLTEFARFNDES
ncbi:MAG: hypothetical protein ACRCWB_03865 [Enterovibrio sp.]